MMLFRRRRKVERFCATVRKLPLWVTALQHGHFFADLLACLQKSASKPSMSFGNFQSVGNVRYEDFRISDEVAAPVGVETQGSQIQSETLRAFDDRSLGCVKRPDQIGANQQIVPLAELGANQRRADSFAALAFNEPQRSRWRWNIVRRSDENIRTPDQPANAPRKARLSPNPVILAVLPDGKRACLAEDVGNIRRKNLVCAQENRQKAQCFDKLPICDGLGRGVTLKSSVLLRRGRSEDRTLTGQAL